MKKNYKYEILTPDGFKKFTDIKKNIKDRYVKLTLENKNFIICSFDHPFYINNKKINANKLTINDHLCTVDGGVRIINIENFNNEIELYDIIDVGEKHIFYANDIAVFNCDGSFLSSGESVVSGEILEWYRLTYVMEPTEKTGFDKNVWIWEYPDFNKNYIVVADVSRGDGRDYSTFHVIDLETTTQAAEYQGKVGTKEFANMLVEYSTKYNDALLIIENTGIGWAVIQGVIDRDYKNLYYTKEKSPYMDDKKTSNYLAHMHRYDRKATAGFTTSGGVGGTRPLIITKMEQYFNEKTVIVRSRRLINELLTFVWKSGKAEAASDRYNDDLVMALAIGLWVRDTAIKLQSESKKLIRAALDSFKVERTDYSAPVIQQRQVYNADPHKFYVGNEELNTRDW